MPSYVHSHLLTVFNTFRSRKKEADSELWALVHNVFCDLAVKTRLRVSVSTRTFPRGQVPPVKGSMERMLLMHYIDLIVLLSRDR
jgi:hypothetical protein